jgi:hypothetical protein
MRNWEGLNPSYRGRLERSGMTKSSYNSGASLAAARGHKATPEHPERASRSPDKYRDYVARRAAMERAVDSKKKQLFGSSAKWNSEKSLRNIRKGQKTGRPAKMSVMKTFLNTDPDDLFDLIDWQDDDWEFLYYH